MTDEVWTNPGGDAKIKVHECGQCSWVIRHPIRWCSNCGGELRVVEMREREYYERSHKFHLDTGWTWSEAKYDYDTGKPRVDDKENGKERE